MGIFRSLGALARAVGPMLASTREYNPGPPGPQTQFIGVAPGSVPSVIPELILTPFLQGYRTNLMALP